MKTDKFLGLLLDNGIQYDIDPDKNTVLVFTGSCMKQNYMFLHNDRTETVRFQYTVSKWCGAERYGEEAGRRFLRNLEHAPHRITCKKQGVR